MSATLETGQKYFAMGLSADTEMVKNGLLHLTLIVIDYPL